MRNSSWSSDVCSSELVEVPGIGAVDHSVDRHVAEVGDLSLQTLGQGRLAAHDDGVGLDAAAAQLGDRVLRGLGLLLADDQWRQGDVDVADVVATDVERSEEHTSELKSLMRTSYAVFCLKKKK